MGKSKGSSLKSAPVHFKNYLINSKHSKLSLDAPDESEITREFIGKFACYLMQCVPSIKKYSTSDNYFSAIRVALELKYPVKMASLSKAYKALRESMFSKCRKESIESGVKFVEGAPIMISKNLSYIRRKCLMDQSFELRCSYLMDKFRVGWCTEVSSIYLASFHSLLNNLMLRVQLYYGATSNNTRMMMKMHRVVLFEDRNYR